jgi:hypothetical protein
MGRRGVSVVAGRQCWVCVVVVVVVWVVNCFALLVAENWASQLGHHFPPTPHPAKVPNPNPDPRHPMNRTGVEYNARPGIVIYHKLRQQW